ncbi:MAG: hypothetical protein ABI927_05285 [Gaiellaceae bacterium]
MTDDDVTLVVQALFDIRTELRLIRHILEDDNGEQEDDSEDP